MRKRFSINIFNKLTGHEPSQHEVAGSHAYGKTARSSPSIPKTRRTSPAQRRAAVNYRDSMVGSTMQYRDRLPVTPKTPPIAKGPASIDGIIGNRPQSRAVKNKTGTNPSAPPRSFVEPPRRNFNPYD